VGNWARRRDSVLSPAGNRNPAFHPVAILTVLCRLLWALDGVLWQAVLISTEGVAGQPSYCAGERRLS
jgi:hypothetical protein